MFTEVSTISSVVRLKQINIADWHKCQLPILNGSNTVQVKKNKWPW